jgi:hypothetical protein
MSWATLTNEHDSCDGIVKTVINGSDNMEMCAYQCHNSSYQLVKKMWAVLRRALDGLDAKGVLRHTDDAIERYYLVHSG